MKPHTYDCDESRSQQLRKSLAMNIRIDSMGRIFFDGREIGLNRSGNRALDLIASVCDSFRSSSSVFECRKSVREIVKRYGEDNSGRGGRAAINQVISLTRDDRVLRIVIWLAGHCHGPMSNSYLAGHRTHFDNRIRREVARALKRTRGWSILRDIAASDPDANVRMMATESASRGIQSKIESLAIFAGPCNLSPPRRQQLFVDASVVSGNRKTPKSRQVIRHYLNRIRRVLNPG